MRLLVTGGAGFIGSEFVRMTLREHPEDSVVVLDKLTYAGNERNLDPVRDDPRFRFVKGDIADPAVGGTGGGRVRRDRQLRRRVARRPLPGGARPVHPDRRLRHLRAAGGGARGGAPALPPGEHRRGLRGRRRGPLPGGRPAPAAQPVQRQQGRAARCWCRPTAPPTGCPAIVTRGSNTYGWYQYPEKIIPLFITNAVEGRPLPIYGDGGAVRDYIFVEDHCRGIDLALRRGAPGEDYNIGAGRRDQRDHGGRHRAPPARTSRRSSSSSSPTAPATTAATPWTPPSCGPWAGSRASTSSRGWSDRALVPGERGVVAAAQERRVLGVLPAQLQAGVRLGRHLSARHEDRGPRLPRASSVAS